MTTNLSEQFLLDPEVVFLNHGSFGACPRPVFEAYQRWQVQLERQPVEFLDSRRGLARNLKVVREALAAEFGSAVDNIAAVTNATTGLNIVAQSIPLAAGDEILTTDHEYAALEKTWAFVTRRTGARVVEIEVLLPLVAAEQFAEAIIAGMTERTKVLFLSHITSPTALLFPLEAVLAEARRRGIISVIDGAHTPGHVPLALDALGADFYSGNCHKWLMSAKGCGFLYARPDRQDGIHPVTISHGLNKGFRAESSLTNWYPRRGACPRKCCASMRPMPRPRPTGRTYIRLSSHTPAPKAGSGLSATQPTDWPYRVATQMRPRGGA